MADRRALESRSLYIPPNVLAPSELPPLSRQVVWNRSADRERCKSRVVEWPEVRVIYYNVQPEELKPVEALVTSLDAALAKLPAATEGLNLSYLYPQKPEDEPDRGWFEVPDTEGNRVPRTRILERDAFFSTRLRWAAGDLAGIDKEWEPLWDALGEFCREDRQANDADGHYFALQPEQFAKLLISNLE